MYIKQDNRFFPEVKNTQSNIISIKISNDTLNIDKGSFLGNVEKAKEAIQAYANKNDIYSKSYGFGYGTLTVNGKNHDITPYGIDILMMLDYCGIDESDLSETYKANLN